MRELSVPERVGAFGFLAASGAAVWPMVTAGTGLALPCPLRTVTGIPCPACGMTTAAVALVRGQVDAAFQANPLIFGLAALTVVSGALLALRATGVMPPPVPWSSAQRRRTGRAIGLLALASWLFQLHRLAPEILKEY
jgi:ribose/xylose/arabinose/galactoside ABC-type transport system permease subunit